MSITTWCQSHLVFVPIMRSEHHAQNCSYCWDSVPVTQSSCCGFRPSTSSRNSSAACIILFLLHILYHQIHTACALACFLCRNHSQGFLKSSDTTCIVRSIKVGNANGINQTISFISIPTNRNMYQHMKQRFWSQLCQIGTWIMLCSWDLMNAPRN